MKHATIYCRGRGILTFGIRVLDGLRQWSHQAGILADGEHVIEPLAPWGVVVTPLAEVVRRSREFIIVERDVPNKAVGDDWAHSTVGRGYDFSGAISVPWNRDWQRGERYYCSEHDEMWLEACGLTRIRPGTRGVSPNDSYMMV